jgi:fructose-specific phosphotransferase system IIC component
MSAAIFFGGLVVGFLCGWVFIALLTMTSERNQRALADALVYYRLSAAQAPD